MGATELSWLFFPFTFEFIYLQHLQQATKQEKYVFHKGEPGAIPLVLHLYTYSCFSFSNNEIALEIYWW